MAEIQLINVGKTFGTTKVIENLNLTIESGKFTVLVGSSGCGKTTLLRMIAGIGPQTSGKILIDGKDVTGLPPAYRDIAMVFQNYALYPTMTVRENIEFGLKNNKVPKEEREMLIKDVSTTVGLSEYLDRKPSTLSGGQRQRVALARAMVKKPKAFLMDEPLSNLDAKLRVTMRSELIELHNRLGITFVYVTHDQVEAMSMADKIVLMSQGKIIQEAAPHDMYSNPNSIFTAQFIGTPPMNIFSVSEKYRMGIRPEKIILTEPNNAPEGAVKGTVITKELLGSETLYRIQVNNKSIVTVKTFEDRLQMQQSIALSFAMKDLYVFDQDGKRIMDMNDHDLQKLLQENGGLI